MQAQGLWTQRASLPDSARYDGIGFSIGNYGYAGLGITNINNGFNDFWQFNPATNTWKKMANFPGKARICPATFVIGHKAYVISGADSSNFNYLTECWEYDATIDTWTKKNNFPGNARTWAFGFVIGNKCFIGTGYNASSTPAFYKDLWEYDTTTDAWMQKSNFAGDIRAGSNSFAISGKGYVCFGQDTAYQGFSDIWEYDTNGDKWTQKSTYPGIPLFGASGFAIGTNFYVGTGATKNGASDSYEQAFWKYDAMNDNWAIQAKFIGINRSNGNVGFVIADSGYLGMGIDSVPNYHNDFYKFYPDTLTGINEIIATEEGIDVFPNPSTGLFTIKSSLNSKQMSIEVYNLLGEKIYSENPQLAYGGTKIDISNEPVGVYILKLASPNSNFYTRIIIN